jgi:siroheme synthase-like protein
MDHELHSNKLFPVFLKLEQLPVLIIGGGNIGLEKIRAVLSNSPACQVKLVALSILPEITRLQESFPNLILARRAFQPEDLGEAALVITATGNRILNEQIRLEATSRRLLINVADTPDLCDFYLGSVVQKGSLKIAISTNGKSPTMAKRIKEVLNEVFPGETEEVLENLAAIRGTLKTDLSEKMKKLNAITAVMAAKPVTQAAKQLQRVGRAALYSLIVIALLVIGHLLFLYLPDTGLQQIAQNAYRQMDPRFALYVAGGFLAQMIDGALGMAYGVSVTTFLLSLGIPAITPAIASASMHASEIFTTGSSSLLYMRYKNVNMKLFRKLVLPGAIGAVAGAIAVSYVSKEYIRFIKPLVAIYTLVLGVLIVIRTLRVSSQRGRKIKRIIPVAAAGGFLDSVGGGGWGPIVTTSLIAGGRNMRYAVGSSHLAKFFVAIISTVTFISIIGLNHWQIISGLIIGSMVAAPFSIYFSNKIPIKAGLILVGTLVIIVSLRILILAIL